MTYFLAKRRFLKTTAAVLLFLLAVGILRSLSGCGGGSTGSTPDSEYQQFPAAAGAHRV